MTRRVEADYLVVGAGATGMAFTDALIDHADARVALIDRRHGVGGHWLDAYPFVQLHFSSAFYGVASTLLGEGRVQQQGPEAGLHERASGPEITAYYDRVLRDRFLPSGQVELFTSCDYTGGHTFVSRVSGQRFEVSPECRVVDARYLAPDIPADTPPPFAVADGVTAIPVGELARLEEAPGQFVIAGAGKTASDACVWLLQRGVDPDAICWVRPRDPWMISRACFQPDPALFIDMGAAMMQAAAEHDSPEGTFLRLEDEGVMLRLDPTVMPTMARTPTLAVWERDLLATIGNVVRLGHLKAVEPGRLSLAEGSVEIARDAVVVHCAAAGLPSVPPLPIWGPDAITPQQVRLGFACYSAALAGYVEATREDDAEKNRLCPSIPYWHTMAGWADANVQGMAASGSFGKAPDIRAWTAGVALDPTRIPPGYAGGERLDRAAERFLTHVGPGLAHMAEWGSPDVPRA